MSNPAKGLPTNACTVERYFYALIAQDFKLVWEGRDKDILKQPNSQLLLCRKSMKMLHLMDLFIPGLSWFTTPISTAVLQSD